MEYRGYEITKVRGGWQVDDGRFPRRTFRTLEDAKDAIDHTGEMRELGG